MARLQIYQDTRSPGTCRSCAKPIIWAELTSGRRMPFNPPLVAADAQESLLTSGRIIETIDTAVSSTHFQTCPQAKDWRKR